MMRKRAMSGPRFNCIFGVVFRNIIVTSFLLHFICSSVILVVAGEAVPDTNMKPDLSSSDGGGTIAPVVTPELNITTADNAADVVVDDKDIQQPPLMNGGTPLWAWILLGLGPFGFWFSIIYLFVKRKEQKELFDDERQEQVRGVQHSATIPMSGDDDNGIPTVNAVLTHPPSPPVVVANAIPICESDDDEEIALNISSRHMTPVSPGAAKPKQTQTSVIR